MAQFSVNTHRFDPYKNFKFRVKWDGKFVAGVSKISAPKRTIEAIASREGGDPSRYHMSPAAAKFDPITLEQGITFDDEFEKWANLVNHPGGDGGMSLKNFRKDITIQLLNEAGQVVKAINVFRCWVSEFSVLPELDANGNAVAIQTITIVHEGWERDPAVVEQPEP